MRSRDIPLEVVSDVPGDSSTAITGWRTAVYDRAENDGGQQVVTRLREAARGRSGSLRNSL
jgi:hypothetical protein